MTVEEFKKYYLLMNLTELSRCSIVLTLAVLRWLVRVQPIKRVIVAKSTCEVTGFAR